jgi:O-acetyl-ADP-ribose deacetylase (regulator of RNase III)
VEINYVIGDATQPPEENPAIIVHVCNDIGGWGRGFVMALSKRWKEPEQQYRSWHRGDVADLPFELGQVQFVQVEPQIWVANVIGQRDIHPMDDLPPVRYDAIRKGLRRVAQEARERGAMVHMPRIGAGLAGGKWEEIERIVKEELADLDVPVFVYDLPS